MACKIVIVKAYVHTYTLGALEVRSPRTGETTVVAPPIERSTDYRIGQILTFTTKKAGNAFMAQHPGIAEAL